MENQNCIDYNSIQLTINELNKIGDTILTEKLNNILIFNELPKPQKHNKISDITTSYYNVTLDMDDIEKIEILFLKLEVQALDKNYDTTITATLYSEIGSKWANIRTN